ncbi:glycosyl hydrolase family 95 catalytic domain-containing protein [Paenibacillus terrigena]|uniref:glycosyl hydrolase family 95 catalytic domain-containing protein n=1 Tax=Paenibacillus terrigena TaxID=369333 RepID=UPI0028D09395|nr:cohesin domain-containing protein [Paenibacillus terrigena]
MSKIMRKVFINSLAFTLISASGIGLDLAKPAVSYAAGGPGQSSMLNVDYDSMVSQADLYFNKQVSASYLGMPIGNGRVGGLVWTEPTKLKTQVNRVDVFGHNGASSATSLHGDYFGAVGNVSVDFGGTVFPSNNVPQYLSMYNATENIQGTNLTADVLAWSDQDVIAIQVNDTRTTPAPINIDLSMTRSGPLETKNNYSATSVISQNNGKIILTQKYEEPTDTNLPINNFYNMSAAVIDVAGRTATASQIDTKTMRLSIPASTGSFTIFIGSAASMNNADDVAAIATTAVDTAKNAGYSNIYNSHTSWWHEYWSKSFISFPAVQGMGYDKDYGAHFVNFYYLMASCFRGAYPAKFNGLLFNTDNGKAMWGTEYWIFNDSRAYYGLETGNHSDLLDPFLNMITSNLNKYQTAAQQQWGSQGIYIPETSPFDGPEVLPDNIAASLQNSLLNGLDLATDVKNFMNNRIAGADSRWTIDGTGGQWKSGWHSHLVYDAADIANMYWDRYLYTMDTNYLRTTAYPVIKGTAEFYRTFPNLKKGTDNKYHIYKTAFAETIWGADDILNDLNYIRGLLPTAIKAAQLLNVDSNLIPLWQDIVDNLAPNPLSSDSNSIYKRTREDGKPTYALARSPYIYLLQNAPSVWDEYQVELLDFDQVNLESKANGLNLSSWDLNMNTLETQEAYTNYMKGEIAGIGIRSWSRFMTDAARMGRSDVVKLGLASNLKQWQSLIVSNPNRLPSTNGGTQTMSIQEDGVFVEGMQNGLLQSLAKGPGENPVIYAFGAWPADIDAAFQLQAKKGFTVTASQRSQNIEFVEIYSSLGQTADVNNPWGAVQSVDLYRNGAKAETLTGRLLTFQTSVGEDVVIVKSGITPSQYQRTISYAKPIFVSAEKTMLRAGEATQLAIAGSNLSGATISYTSKSPSIASVSSSGLVTANGNGTTVITVKAMSGSTVIASGQITVTVSSLINDTDAGISYIGSFSYSSNRNLGDYEKDVHQTQTNNDYFQYTFTGTGIDYIGVKNGDIGNQDIYIDGELVQTVSGTAPSYTAQSVIYSNKNLTNGTHTIKVVKRSGYWMVLDALRVYRDSELKSITVPAEITGLTNGTAKTAAALGLPSHVVMNTSTGNANANVTWNVEASSYDPAVKSEQTFTVEGTVILPEGVDNPNNVVLITSIRVTVLRASTIPQSTLTAAPQVSPGQTFDVTMGLSNVTQNVYQEIYAQDLTFHYDPVNLKLDSVTSRKDGFEIIDQKESVLGHIRIVAASVGGNQGVSAQGDMLKFRFTVKSETKATDTTISLGNVTIANGEGNELEIGGTTHELQINAVVDKSLLNALIATAQARHDAAVEGNGHGLYTKGSKVQLQSAIDAASATANDLNATQQQVDSAKTALDVAIQVFESKKINADVNGKEGVTIGDLAIVAAAYGKQQGQEGWNVKTDVNKDGKVDIEDLAIVARAILQ